jgi:hypothetical protein
MGLVFPAWISGKAPTQNAIDPKIIPAIAGSAITEEK